MTMEQDDEQERYRENMCGRISMVIQVRLNIASRSERVNLTIVGLP